MLHLSGHLVKRVGQISQLRIRRNLHTDGEIPLSDLSAGGLTHLKAMGYKTAAMALKEDSVSIDDPRLLSEEKLAVILGTEGDGLASATIDGCDYTVMIPMAHGVDSLNVAAASAVAFWELSRH